MRVTHVRRTFHRAGTLVLFMLGFCALQLFTAAPAQAQRDTTGVGGKVVDHEGQPIEGATVLIKETARGVERDTETNEEGEFRFRGLRPGEYEVTVEKEEYRGVQEVVNLRIGRPATREYRLIPAVSPAEAAFRRGIAAYNEGNLEEAARAFEEAVELAPEVVESHSNLAGIYARLGREEDALRELEKVTELAPESFAGFSQLGASYAMLNRLDKAIETYEAALEMEHDPSDPAALDAWMNLGTLYFMNDRARDAIAAYEKVLETDPNSAKALLSIGKAQFNLGETEEALATFRKVVEVAPGSSEATEAEGYVEQIESAQASP